MSAPRRLRLPPGQVPGTTPDYTGRISDEQPIDFTRQHTAFRFGLLAWAKRRRGDFEAANRLENLARAVETGAFDPGDATALTQDEYQRRWNLAAGWSDGERLSYLD